MDSEEKEKKSFAMPGDVLTEAEEKIKTKTIVLGPGVARVKDRIIAIKPGVIRKKENVFWIDGYQKRYVPVRGELVIGIVSAKVGDLFRVDIGAHRPACLSYLAFEGATKKNRPDINVGDLLFGKVTVASKDLEPEIVCVDSFGKKGKMGVLAGGFLFSCSLNLIRKILHKNCPLFQCLKREMPYEIAVGMNGRIWIKAKTCKETIALGQAILTAEFIPNGKIPDMCTEIGNRIFA